MMPSNVCIPISRSLSRVFLNFYWRFSPTFVSVRNVVQARSHLPRGTPKLHPPRAEVWFFKYSIFFCPFQASATTEITCHCNTTPTNWILAPCMAPIFRTLVTKFIPPRTRQFSDMYHRFSPSRDSPTKHFRYPCRLAVRTCFSLDCKAFKKLTLDGMAIVAKKLLGTCKKSLTVVTIDFFLTNYEIQPMSSLLCNPCL